MSTGETWTLGHRPALDGLRGIAILLVVASHSLIGTGSLLLGGSVGVTLFFTLSGYLITGLFLPDADTGRLSLGRFYARRARRLLPAALVLIATMPGLLLLARDPYLAAYPREAAASLLYVRNLVAFDRGHGFDGVLGHMWSLSVEEQFYLLWPAALVVVLAAARRFRVSPAWVVGGLFVAALAWRVAVAVTLEGSFIYSRLDTNAAALLAGAAVAVFESRGRAVRSRRLAVASMVGLLVVANWPTISLGVQMWTGVAVALCAIPLVSRAGDSLAWLSHPLLGWFGRVSYGWYLWHVALMCVWVNGEPPGSVQRWAASLAGLGIAALSWRYIEQPILQRRRLHLRPEVRDLHVHVRV